MEIIKARKLRKIEDEAWKELPGSEGMYSVSNYGRIKSFAYDKVNGRILKPNLVGGLYIVSLKGKTKHPRHIHRIVANVWLQRPQGPEYTHVIHIDGNPRNNHFKNLQWVTKAESLEHNSALTKKRNEKLKKSDLIRASKLKEADVRLLKSMMERGVPQNAIAKMFRISEMQVTRIKRGENWGHVTI